MSPEIQEVLKQLKSLLSNPVVQNALLLILTGLIPRSVLDRLPIVGTIVTLIKTVLEAQNAKQEAKKVDAGAVIAQATVQGFEQLKHQGKVDGPTAAAETTRIIADKTGISPELARILTEQAVRQVKKEKVMEQLAKRGQAEVNLSPLPQTINVNQKAL